jgi:hypothetical protein
MIVRILLLWLVLSWPSLAVIHRYVNTNSTAGGDGTTTATAGANRAWESLNTAVTTLDNAQLTDDVIVHCAGTAADTTAVGSIDVDTSTFTLTIQVDTADRHTGTYDTNKYRLEATNTLVFRNNTTLRLRVIGLQVKLTRTTGSPYAMKLLGANHTGNYDIIYSHNLVQCTSTTDTIGMTADDPASGTGTVSMYNNVIWGCGVGITGLLGSSFHVFNNTVADASYGIVADDAFLVKNNAVYNSANIGFVGSFAAGSNYNCESDGNGGPGANHASAVTFTFTNAASHDYSLQAGDTGARGRGVVDPSGTNLFTDDVVGYARPGSGTWDCGAFQYQTPAATMRRRMIRVLQ